MRARVIALAVTAVLLAASGCADESTSPQSSATNPPASSEAAKPLNDALAQRLDAAINQAMTAAGVPGAIIGIWGPDGNYVRAFGVADKTTRAPMKTDFYSRIGSVTKTFTVTAVLQLADQGKLGLDDPIAEFVDGVPLGDRITLRQLARMQSGLFNFSASPAFQQAMFADPRRTFTPHELLDYAFAQPNQFPPGEGFEYCNTNTVLLGLVVQKVSGQPLHSFIHDQILIPLGMSHTNFPTTNAFPDPHAQGYTVQTADGKEAAATDWNPSWGWAAGAMISTLDDMSVWAPAMATGKSRRRCKRSGCRQWDHPGCRRRTATGWASSTSAGGSDTTAACPAIKQSRTAEADHAGHPDQHGHRVSGRRAKHHARDRDHQRADAGPHLLARSADAALIVIPKGTRSIRESGW